MARVCLYSPSTNSIMDNNELKYEILQLKKNFSNIYAENQLLKVKLRKLENDNIRKNKQIECLIDPKNCNNIRKIVSERGAILIIQLKERCENLESEVLTKDLKLRKLESEIDRLKAFKCPKMNVKRYKNSAHAASRNSTLKCFSSFSSSPVTSSTDSNNEQFVTEQQKLDENLRKIRQVKHYLTDCDISIEYNQNVKNEDSEKYENATTIEIKSVDSLENKEANIPQTPKNKNESVNIEKVHSQIDYVVNDIKEMKDFIYEMHLEYRNMREIMEEKTAKYDDLYSQVKQLENKIKSKKFSISSIKKSFPIKRNKLSRNRITVQNDNIYNPETIPCSSNNIYNNLSKITKKIQKYQINDSDDEDVQTGI